MRIEFKNEYSELRCSYRSLLSPEGTSEGRSRERKSGFSPISEGLQFDCRIVYVRILSHVGIEEMADRAAKNVLTLLEITVRPYPLTKGP